MADLTTYTMFLLTDTIYTYLERSKDFPKQNKIRQPKNFEKQIKKIQHVADSIFFTFHFFRISRQRKKIVIRADKYKSVQSSTFFNFFSRFFQFFRHAHHSPHTHIRTFSLSHFCDCDSHEIDDITKRTLMKFLSAPRKSSPTKFQ